MGMRMRSTPLNSLLTLCLCRPALHGTGSLSYDSNDRMTPLDYDLFRKCQALMGVTPDFFEVCLMVRKRVRSEEGRHGPLISS